MAKSAMLRTVMTSTVTPGKKHATRQHTCGGVEQGVGRPVRSAARQGGSRWPPACTAVPCALPVGSALPVSRHVTSSVVSARPPKTKPGRPAPP